MFVRLALIAFSVIAWIAPAAARSEPVDADLVLAGGTLYLGDGSEPRQGDVAIRGGRIVAVGQFERGRVDRTIDCSGLAVSPGFIDLHNHSDSPIVAPETRAAVNYLTQGCTTIVTGNCGSGPVDTGRFYERIDAAGAGVNVAHLLPQGSLRGEVIGTVRRAAEPAELERMKQLARQAMRDGAWGMSTGLIYVPSSYASTEELVELAKVVAEEGGIYASHIRNENVELLEAVDEALRIGRRAGLPVHISHFKSSGKNSWGLVRVAIERIEERQAEGQKVTADQYPYTASSTSLEATVVPTWARSGGRREMLRRMDDPPQMERIQAAIERKLEECDDGYRIQIVSYQRQPNWAGRRVSEIAREQGESSLALVLRILRSGGAKIVNHGINEEDVRYVMQRPWVATASDGRAYLPGATVPHPRNYGTFPRKIGFYAVEQKALPLRQAVRSASGLPADILGLPDRGYLRAGMQADIAVWDPDQLRDAATFEKPHQYSTGMRHVLVNGVPAIADGVPTGALAGRALVRPGSAGTPKAQERGENQR